MSIVRDNLMSDKSYRPYCAVRHCFRRTIFNKKKGQFECPVHSFETSFEPEFIETWKEKWGIG